MLSMNIIHSVHIYYVFMLLSILGSVLIIDQISYASIEFHFVLEYVDYVFRKFEEKPGEYKELSIVGDEEKHKSEKKKSDNIV